MTCCSVLGGFLLPSEPGAGRLRLPDGCLPTVSVVRERHRDNDECGAGTPSSSPVSTVRERRWDDISLGWCGNTDRASIEDSAASSLREKGTPASTRFLGLGTPLNSKLLRGRGAQCDSPPRSDLEAEGKGGRPRLEKGVAGLFFALSRFLERPRPAQAQAQLRRIEAFG